MLQKRYLTFLLIFAVYVTMATSSDYAQNRLIVEYVDGTTAQERQVIRSEYNATLVEYLPKLNVEIWDIFNFPFFANDGSPINNIVDVQGNAIRKAKVNGSGLDYFAEFPEIELEDCGINPSTPYNPLSCCPPEDTVNCGVDTNLVKIGVIDTGADFGSPQIFYNPYGVLTTGYDFVNNDPNPEDNNGHGTQMTSIIGGILFEQAAPNIRILPLKALDANGIGMLSDIIRAVHFAICEQVDILNLSLGYVAAKEDQFDQFFKNILQKAINQNMLPIVAAGNLGECIGLNQPYYPASFELEGMLTIGASECTDGYATFSNYGKPIDLLAPGVQIFCRDLGAGNQIFANGTSHATAMASGMVAALATQMMTFDAVTLRNDIVQEVDACVANILDADIPCHPNYATISNLFVNFTPPIDSVYTANTLISDAIIPSNQRITFKASQTITLRPGFIAGKGSCFAAAILECTPFTFNSSPPNVALSIANSTVTASELPSLEQNYPNPFRGSTIIPYDIKSDYQNAHIELIDIKGNSIKRFQLSQSSGQILLTNQLKSGLYFYVLYVDGVMQASQKMLVWD